MEQIFRGIIIFMNICFVCQAGILESQSILLAISLKKQMPKEKLIACIPKQFGDIDFFTKKLLNKLEIEQVIIKNHFNPLYPCGNKLAASLAGFSNNDELSLFLDSDLVCFKPLNISEPTVITTGRFDVITHKEWMNIFSLFGMKMPIEFEHIRSPFIFSNLSFVKQWHDNCIKLWNSAHAGKLSLRKIRQIDQISLTITTLQFKNFEILDWHNNKILQSPSEIYNFNEELKLNDWPVFLVLQKGWLYYERQGFPNYKSSNPNSLAYYPEIRSLIYNCLADYPDLDRIPSWDGVYKFYFSQNPINDQDFIKYMRGVEVDQK